MTSRSRLQTAVMRRRGNLLRSVLLLFGGAVLLTIMPTQLLSGQQPKTSVSSILFDDEKTEENVLDCITGEVIGARPKHVDTVDIRRTLPSNDQTEVDSHRRAMFRQMFNRRVWGTNPKVNFSASGMSRAMLITQ